ncbi:MAG: bifunctional phosphopantothenoylcysteine decarboxylase/phosphopantothenate--cysteine ligase CoaBC [Lentimicrobium sp.]|jgi:phosphopantothenoylcysteine decarboxylase/phosphopantothenate--cysteine ligase|nr:bifunctional phosphopantothenoylcysteine decarboxylase/phosphopantothenate--cysteine ligase CoaBC [Lentimicrobium sp.]
MLQGKKILIGISGSIAAYKVPLLVRLLIKEGAEVKVVMSPVACDFVTPLTLSTLSQQPVLIEPYNKIDGSWNSHVDWGRWADLFVMAPVSANTLAKMAAGIADNLLTTTYLAAKCPVLFAPAMDLDMFHHPTTQKNIETLISYGNHLIQPQVGELASGLYGEGRMEEPETIFEVIRDYFLKINDLSGKRILISAGPTHEAIDPVRFIGNYSSGKMGFELAREAANRGARVILVAGPVDINLSHKNVDVIQVKSAKEMADACLEVFPECDLTIMAAAVADYTIDTPAPQKIKKAGDKLSLELIKTTDILAEMGKMKKPGQFLTGFALETENETSNAFQKLKQKNLDLIVLNSLKDKGAGFGTDTNKVTLIFKDEITLSLPLASKTEVAKRIFDAILPKVQAL